MDRETCASSLCASLILGMGILGITRKWTGAWGFTSLNARHYNKTHLTCKLLIYKLFTISTKKKNHKMLPHNILIKVTKDLWSVTYFLIFINDHCRNSFVNYFRKYSGFRFSVLLAGLLCQANLITRGRAEALTQTSKQTNPQQQHLS